MNENTKRALLDFVDAVEKLAVGTIHMIGEETAKEILDSCFKLKGRISKDETIPD